LSEIPVGNYENTGFHALTITGMDQLYSVKRTVSQLISRKDERTRDSAALTPMAVEAYFDTLEE